MRSEPAAQRCEDEDLPAIDLHVHSAHSDRPYSWFLRSGGSAECSTRVDDAYAIAKPPGPLGVAALLAGTPAIVRLLRDGELRRRMRREAVRHAQRYDLAAAARELFARYARMLDPAAPARSQGLVA